MRGGQIFQLSQQLGGQAPIGTAPGRGLRQALARRREPLGELGRPTRRHRARRPGPAGLEHVPSAAAFFLRNAGRPRRCRRRPRPAQGEIECPHPVQPSSRSSPSPPASGCLSSASSGTGARSSAAAEAIASSRFRRQSRSTACRNCHRLRSPSGASSDDTRRASTRSGVTRAAVRPGTSIASRRASAMPRIRGRHRRTRLRECRSSGARPA